MLKQEILKTKPLNVRSLYDSYASMLLDYIFAIVKDKQVAESYLSKYSVMFLFSSVG